MSETQAGWIGTSFKLVGITAPAILLGLVLSSMGIRIPNAHSTPVNGAASTQSEDKKGKANEAMSAEPELLQAPSALALDQKPTRQQQESVPPPGVSTSASKSSPGRRKATKVAGGHPHHHHQPEDFELFSPTIRR